MKHLFLLALLNLDITACGSASAVVYVDEVVTDGNHPLITPTLSDINQGNAYDCWLLSTLGAVITVDPNILVNLITVNNDESWTLHLYDKNSKPTLVTVQPDYSTDQNYNLMSNPNLINWPKAFEIAYEKLYHQTLFLGEDAGVAYNMLFGVFPNAVNLKNSDDLMGSNEIRVLPNTIGNYNIGLVDDHYYTVMSIDKNTTVLRNPWGNQLDNPFVTLPTSVLEQTATVFYQLQIKFIRN